MLPPDLHFLTIAQASALLKARQLSPVELTRAFLDRAEKLDPQLNAYLLLTADRALALPPGEKAPQAIERRRKLYLEGKAFRDGA